MHEGASDPAAGRRARTWLLAVAALMLLTACGPTEYRPPPPDGCTDGGCAVYAGPCGECPLDQTCHVVLVNDAGPDGGLVPRVASYYCAI